MAEKDNIRNQRQQAERNRDHMDGPEPGNEAVLKFDDRSIGGLKELAEANIQVSDSQEEPSESPENPDEEQVTPTTDEGDTSTIGQEAVEQVLNQPETNETEAEPSPASSRLEQIAAGVGSFLMPGDLALLLAGGLPGAAAKAAVGARAARILQTAGALGTYEGAKAAFEGKLETGEFRAEDVAAGGLRGATLGAILGVAGVAAAPVHPPAIPHYVTSVPQASHSWRKCDTPALTAI
ncbi:MAG: hypothetical protein IH880_05420 [Candidatus Marinimicrobia bacterium]|nr:hypothetical protein [Candidatus Neomarinimicrobiota bacterium]